MTPPFYMTAFWSIITTILDICKVQILDNNMQFLETILDSVKMTIISHKNLQNTEIRNSCAFYSREGKHKCFYFGHFFFQFIHSLLPPLLRFFLQGNQVSEEFLNTFRHCNLQILLSKFENGNFGLCWKVHLKERK